jgi:hypothetical protein
MRILACQRDRYIDRTNPLRDPDLPYLCHRAR